MAKRHAAHILALAPFAVGTYPWLCPPPAGWSACPNSYDTRVPQNVEQNFHSSLDRMLMHRSANPKADAMHIIYESMLTLLEGLRIADCVIAFGPPCMPVGDFKRTMGELCPHLSTAVKKLQAEAEGASATRPLREHHACWRETEIEESRFASFQALPLLLELARRGSRSDLVSEWMASKTPFPRGPVVPPSTPWLLYPSAFVPPNACSLDSFGAKLPFRFLPEDETHRPWRDVSDQFSPFMDVQAALKRLERKHVPMSRFVINLGAANGACGWGSLYDPANCLLMDTSANVTGILFEGKPDNFDSLLGRYNSGRRKQHLRLGYTRPSWATRDVLRVMPADGDIDLLKIDVDNCDSCFVEALLFAKVRPKLIHVEFTTDPPPPIKARAHFSTNPGQVLCGTLAEFLRAAPGYRLLHVEYVNAVFVRPDLYDLLVGQTDMSDEAKWRFGYYCHPLRTVSSWGSERNLRAGGKHPAVLGAMNLSFEELHHLTLTEVFVDGAMHSGITVSY